MATGLVTDITFYFFCVLRGYHVYQTVWSSRLNGKLATEHERSNLYNRHAIAGKKNFSGRLTSSVVSHLPKELSRNTRYIMEYGAVITLEVIDTHPRQSSLIQGGLEIRIKAEVRMPCSEKNRLAMHNYKGLVEQLYKEPVDGVFEDSTKSILQELSQELDDERDSDTDSMEAEDVDPMDVGQGASRHQ